MSAACKSGETSSELKSCRVIGGTIGFSAAETRMALCLVNAIFSSFFLHVVGVEKSSAFCINGKPNANHTKGFHISAVYDTCCEQDLSQTFLFLFSRNVHYTKKSENAQPQKGTDKRRKCLAANTRFLEGNGDNCFLSRCISRSNILTLFSIRTTKDACSWYELFSFGTSKRRAPILSPCPTTKVPPL